MQLIKDIELSVYPQYTSGIKLLQLSSGPHVSRYTSEIPSLPLFALIDLYLFMRKVCHCLIGCFTMVLYVLLKCVIT